MFISLYYISCHQLRVYKNHFIINHDVFRKVYKASNFLKFSQNFINTENSFYHFTVSYPKW